MPWAEEAPPPWGPEGAGIAQKLSFYRKRELGYLYSGSQSCVLSTAIGSQVPVASAPPIMTSKNVSRQGPMFPMGKITQVENSTAEGSDDGL